MVDFPDFEAHPVDVPDAVEMPPHADAGERLRDADIGSAARCRALRASPSTRVAAGRTRASPTAGSSSGTARAGPTSWMPRRHLPRSQPTTSSPIPTTPATSSAPAPQSTSRLPFSFSTGCLEGSWTPASASAGTRPTRSALATAAAASTSRRAPAPRAATPPPASASSCAICMDKPKDLAFGCGHETCYDCGKKLVHCPMCQQHITTRIRLVLIESRPPDAFEACVLYPLGSPGFSTDRLPPNTTTSRGATDPSSYSDDDGEAEVDPNVHPEEDNGEDLFNDDYLK
ncbi:DNA replication licensing factor mcm2 [Hordeum vulgare]|nr:DNA replication licensing factor mcm2 [Hordeum vulgare]